MASELPSASGRSVFSVFGFGSSHYSDDEDFSSPLETAPESFDASHSLTALTKKKKGVPFQEEALVTTAVSTAPKVKVSVPDHSELVLQSFCQPASKPTAAHHLPPAAHHSIVRRYSTTQEETDDALNSSEVLSKFNTTLTQTAYMLTKAGGSNTNIYNSVTESSSADASNTASPPNLMRVQSSPHLSVMASLHGSPQKESSLQRSDFISQYVRRNQSQNDLLEGDDASNKTVALSSPVTSSTQMLKESDVDDFHTSRSSGFGLLSKTRQFGAWLTKATEGEKVEVTKKDLNVLAPNSF